MKLKGQLWILLLVIAITVEGSILLRESLLRPRTSDCFSCRTRERPLAYPLIAQIGKIKDLFVNIFKNIMASARDHDSR